MFIYYLSAAVKVRYDKKLLSKATTYAQLHIVRLFGTSSNIYVQVYCSLRMSNFCLNVVTCRGGSRSFRGGGEANGNAWPHGCGSRKGAIEAFTMCA